MKLIFYFFLIVCFFVVWIKNGDSFQLKKTKNNSNNELDINDKDHISSFLENTNETESEGDNTKDNEASNEAKQENKNEHSSDKLEEKHEEKHEDKHEEKHEETQERKNEEKGVVDEQANNNNLHLLGTHDSQGNFVPSFQLLSNEILSANNALERSSQFLKVACSHILKILEFIPEDKIDAYYVKLDSKNIYLKELGGECHKLYFSVEKLSMSVIVLNSKLYKLAFSPPKQ